MPEIPGGVVRSADISECGRYRYTLSRRWHLGQPRAVFVMLNPSTADGKQDDPTIRRVVNFARSWGMGGVAVVNLYAYRATNPAELWTVDDPVGPDNDRVLSNVFEHAVANGAPILAAWGANAKPDRVNQVLTLAGPDRFTALGLTKNGQPRHPLRLPHGLTPQPWGSRGCRGVGA